MGRMRSGARGLWRVEAQQAVQCGCVLCVPCVCCHSRSGAFHDGKRSILLHRYIPDSRRALPPKPTRPCTHHGLHSRNPYSTKPAGEHVQEFLGALKKDAVHDSMASSPRHASVPDRAPPARGGNVGGFDGRSSAKVRGVVGGEVREADVSTQYAVRSTQIAILDI